MSLILSATSQGYLRKIQDILKDFVLAGRISREPPTAELVFPSSKSD